MKLKSESLLISYLFLSIVIFSANISNSFGASVISDCDVLWETTGNNSWDSMPIGNGDIGCNVWTEGDSDLLFYIGKTDAWSENYMLLKLGRIRIHFFRPVFIAPFIHRLNLKDGVIEISGGSGSQKLSLKFWVDAYHPVIRVVGSSETSLDISTTLEVWRTSPRTLSSLRMNQLMA